MLALERLAASSSSLSISRVVEARCRRCRRTRARRPRTSPSTSEPKRAARAGPCPACSRRSTNSCRPCVLTFSQSRERLPGRYRESRALGHDPLELLLLAPPRAARRRRRTPPRTGRSGSGVSRSFSSRSRRSVERQVDERLALDLEQVEDVVDDRRARLALLHRGEARAALLVERADLAVERRSPASSAPSTSSFATFSKRAVRSLSVAACAARPRRRATVATPVAVPLDLEQPAVARRAPSVGERGEHRPVAARLPRRDGAASSSRLRRISQFFSSPSSCAGTSVHVPFEPLAVQPDGQAAVLLLLEQLVRAACPRSRPCRRRTGPSGSRPRRSRTRAGGPRRGRRGAAGPARAARPSAPPSSRARRRARAGSRSGAAARRGAGRRRSAPSPRFLPPNGSGVFLGSRLRLYSASFALGTRASLPCARAFLRFVPFCVSLRRTRAAPPSGRRPRPPSSSSRLRQLGCPWPSRVISVEQLLAVGVVVLLGLEVGCSGSRRATSPSRPRPSAALADAVDGFRLPHLVGVVHGLEQRARPS